MNEVWLVILPLIAGYLLDLALWGSPDNPASCRGVWKYDLLGGTAFQLAADSGNGKGLSWHCRFLCLPVWPVGG